jgi:outer membrane protein assembly factor BamB
MMEATPLKGRRVLGIGLVILGASTLTIAVGGMALTPAPPFGGEDLQKVSGVCGGLVTVVGLAEADPIATLARTGRHLVHILLDDERAVAALRETLQSDGNYGLASAERPDPSGKLPYTEDLVNLLVLAGPEGGRIALPEAARALRPGGTLLLEPGRATAEGLRAAGLEEAREVDLGGRWMLCRKPRPKALDEWSHPRHGPDGNPVSLDTAVGPPRRIRWVSGPQQEISNTVTGGGRVFFGGVLARDAFNGLKLWEVGLTPSPARGGYPFAGAPGSVQPVAAGDSLYAVTGGKTMALDGATGAVIREYEVPVVPTDLVVEGRLLLAIEASAIHALEIESGKKAWTFEAAAPRCVVAGNGSLFCIRGPAVEGARERIVSVDLKTGKPRWEKTFKWLPKVRRCSVHDGYLACEVSSLSNDGRGNALHLLSTIDGRQLWVRQFTPWMAHYKQARAMFAGGLVWVLQSEEKSGKFFGLDLSTGAERKKLVASIAHCFPPVATARYLISGEMDLIDLKAGKKDANRITKAACSRDAGVIPANGLIYAAPKHCRCWPMLRDYCALAPVRPAGIAPPPEKESLAPEAGPAAAPDAPPEDPGTEWPCYRHDALRSGGTTGAVSRGLAVRWETPLGGWPRGTIADDWRGNYFIRGPVGPPVVARGMVFVTRPDAHQVLALDAKTGARRWTFTANGRVDTAPTIHRGLCLFGSKSGHVYCLRADDGALVWRLRAAPFDERIVAYGQLESPWPVPGTVLVDGGRAFFAAGRQSLADGGIRVFAVDPATGKPFWARALDSVPQKNFYGSTAQDFENFDILHIEGDKIAMSRWLFDRADGAMTCDEKSGFARPLGGAGVLFPRGTWSYAPRDETEGWPERPYVRPLMVFAGRALYGSSQARDRLFRRDFDLAGVDGKFDTDWFSGWDTAKRKTGVRWRAERISKSAGWSVEPFPGSAGKAKVSAMTLTADGLFVAGSDGRLVRLALEDGKVLEELRVPPPSWDGIAAAEGCLFISTQEGGVICCGAK